MYGRNPCALSSLVNPEYYIPDPATTVKISVSVLYCFNFLSIIFGVATILLNKKNVFWFIKMLNFKVVLCKIWHFVREMESFNMATALRKKTKGISSQTT